MNWVSVTAENGHKLLLSLALTAALLVANATVRGLLDLALRGTHRGAVNATCLAGQAAGLAGTLVLLLVFLSIWSTDPTRLYPFCLASAVLAFALQQPLTSIASYFAVLRGSTYTVGSRILGSGLIDQSQKMTVAARATATKKTVGQRS